MADITSLSDEELEKIASSEQSTTNQTVSTSIQDLSDEELQKIAGQQTQTTIADNIPVGGVAGQVVETAVSPLVEMYRGYLKSSEEMYNMANGVAKLVQSASGNLLDTTPIQKLLSQASESIEASEEQLPQTRLAKPIKAVYEMAGQAPAMIAEFAAMPIKGVGSFVIKSAILNSLEEFNKEQTLESLGSGAIEGAKEGSTGELAIRGGLKIMQYGGEILNRFGKKAFESWIRLTTGDDKLAAEAIANPDKFLRKDSRPVQSIMEDYADQKVALAESNKNVLKRLQERIALRLTKLKEEQLIAKDDLIRMNEAQKTVGKDQTAQQVAVLKETSEQALKSQKAVVDSRIQDIYEGGLENITHIERELGKQVGMAKDQLREVAPGVGISFDLFGDKIIKQLQSLPGMKLVNGQLVPVASTPAKEQLAGRANAILSELADYRRTGTIPLDYAFELTQKTGPVQEMISFANKSELLSTYGDRLKKIAEVANLDNLKIDGVNLLVKSQEAKRAVDFLVQKNKEFTTMKTKYDNAMKHYAQKDVNGVWQPNPSRAITALETNNIQKIKEMELADSALPKEDRILPKVRALLDDAKKYEKLQKETLDSNIKALNIEQNKMVSQLDRAELELARSQQKMTAEERKRSAEMLWQIKKRQRTVFRERSNQLKEERDLIVNSKILDSFSAKQFGGVQAGLGVSTVFTGRVAPAVSALLLGPKTAFSAARGAKKAAGAVKGFSEKTGIGMPLKEENAAAIRQLLGL